MQDVGLARDGGRAYRVATAARLADDPRLALGTPVRAPLEPPADVDNREDLVLGRLASHVDGLAVRRGPCLVARVGGMGLAAQLLWQIVVDVARGAHGQGRTVHCVLDVAE